MYLLKSAKVEAKERKKKKREERNYLIGTNIVAYYCYDV